MAGPNFQATAAINNKNYPEQQGVTGCFRTNQHGFAAQQMMKIYILKIPVYL